ncbi:HEPN domain-containing protein [Endozoicomonas sp. ALD040]|uniref:HEPN domain-containing protein n=1 Tax=Endozoicomonas sp. ALD040 TaxID=3403079 RepID=UPI003BB17389
MNKAELESLSSIRIREAIILLENNEFNGACYLAGYSVECALKACICKQVKEFDFPNKKLAQDSHTHNLTDLVGVAGLKQRLKKEEQDSETFKLNWAVVKDWKETSRYETNIEKTRAIDLIEAITDKQSGILQWLKKFW